MALMRWDPTRELDVLQGDMNRLFDSFFQGRGTARADTGAVQRWIPPMDLTETAEEFVLRADLPGMSEEDIEIEVTDNVLKISGERQAEHHDKGEGYYRVERAFGRFSRTLDLPAGVDGGAVRAVFDRGVLEVRIAKPEQSQPRKVQISSGEKGAIETRAEEE